MSHSLGVKGNPGEYFQTYLIFGKCNNFMLKTHFGLWSKHLVTSCDIIYSVLWHWILTIFGAIHCPNQTRNQWAVARKSISKSGHMTQKVTQSGWNFSPTTTWLTTPHPQNFNSTTLLLNAGEPLSHYGRTTTDTNKISIVPGSCHRPHQFRFFRVTWLFLFGLI